MAQVMVWLAIGALTAAFIFTAIVQKRNLDQLNRRLKELEEELEKPF